MKTAYITPTLWLTEVPVYAEAHPVHPTSRGKNNIWIIDRSGSMYHELRNVIADCIDRVMNLPTDDTLTVGWFSSEGGKFGWIVKGLRISTSDDRIAATTMLRRYESTVGMTCFSEILTDLATVVADLRALSRNFALMFMSDGYPIVDNYNAEIKAIHSAISNVSGDLNTVLLVGYGDYYNRELMSSMAEQFGGGLIHSSNLKVFSTAFEKFVNEAAGAQLRQTVKLPKLGNIQAIFSVSGSQITVYQDDDGSVSFAPTGHDDFLYILHTINSGSFRAIGDGTTLGEMERGAYAAAYVMSQRMKADVALGILGALGDVALINALNSAYTNEEAGKAEAAILQATTTPTLRFRGGRNTKYLPDPNAFCVLDALDLLASDVEAKFYPKHPSFQYKRIGRPSKVKGEYPVFESDPNAGSPMSTLTYHDEKLNVSLKSTIQGQVHLMGNYEKHGFGPVYPCVRFRDYAIIADGVLNVSTLPVSLSFIVFRDLVEKGVIDLQVWESGKVYEVHLDRLPVINRSMANGLTSATKLCRDTMLELSFEGQVKALKFLRNERDPEQEILRTTTLTPEQEAFLLENGVNKNGIYAVPTERGEATDFYMAKHFRVKAKGFSSLPPIKDVRERLKKGKEQTPSGQLIVEGLAMFESMAPQTSTRDALAWIDSTLADLTKAMRDVRKSTQRTKFAILLGRKWFDEFTSREDNTLEVDGVQYTIEVVEKRVEL